MVFRRKRTFHKFRKFRKYRKYGRRSSQWRPYPTKNMGLIPSPVANRTFTSLKYCTNIVLTVTTVPQVVSYRANSIYDPDYTFVGHQPLGYDQLMGLYKKWTVVSSAIRVAFRSHTVAATSHTAIVGVNLADAGSSYPTSSVQAREITPKWRLISDSASNGVNAAYCNCNYNAKKYWHLSNIMDCTDQHGQITTDLEAKNDAFYNVWVAGVDDATELEPIEAVVQIVYNVIFFEPKTLDPS